MLVRQINQFKDGFLAPGNKVFTHFLTLLTEEKTKISSTISS